MNDLFSLINYSYVGIWITDHQGNTLYVNKKIGEIHNIPPEKLIGRNVQELLDDGMIIDNKTPHIYEAFQNRSPLVKMVRTYTNRQVLVIVVPMFDEKNQPWRAIVNNYDITELSEDMKDMVIPFTDEISLLAMKIQVSPEREENFLYDKSCYDNYKMQNILSGLLQVAQTDVTILFEGETGVGKEYFAKYVHDISLRKSEPFISINCGAIPENLLEAELFGYEKGAFTGAIKQKMGYFEQAQHGTIMLDEIGELPFAMQVKLLRVLQEKKIQRIGSEKSIDLDIRIIAATNRNLKEMTNEGAFREDLYYRLSIISFVIPPLRERQTTIPHLIKFFTQKVNHKYDKQAIIDPKVIDYLNIYTFPGNIRELENIVTQMIVMSSKKNITIHQIPDYILDEINITQEKNWNLELHLENYEKEFLCNALNSFPSIRKMAIALGVTHPTLLRKIKKYNLSFKKRKP